MNPNNWLTSRANYPAGGNPVWGADSPAGQLLRDEFFGAAPSAIEGQLSETLGSATLASTATIATAGGPVVGSLAVTLGTATLSSTARLALRGQLAATLGAATSAATGRLLVRGTLASTLANATAAATGRVGVAGALSATLGAASLDATATIADVGGPVVGSLNVTLGDATLSAQGNGPVIAVTTGGSWGFHSSPRKKTQWEEEVEAAERALDEVTEAIKADIEQDIEPVPVQRVLVVDAPIALPPIDVSGAIEAAKQAYFDALSEDDEDALNAILAAL